MYLYYLNLLADFPNTRLRIGAAGEGLRGKAVQVEHIRLTLG